MIPPWLAARAVAPEKTLDATATACAQLDCLLLVGRWYVEDGKGREAMRTAD